MIRKPNRLKQYDYSLPGYYFITICTKNKKEIFGKVHGNSVKLNWIREIAKHNLNKFSNIFYDVQVDEYIIMPHHIHLILIIEEYKKSEDRSKMRISKIIQQFKRTVSVSVKEEEPEKLPLWQRYFYDRIIRNERELYNIRNYIQGNPMKWELEKENVENLNYDLIL